MLDQKEKQPFFSVMVPVYNGAAFIEKCLASVLSQTFEDFELIICDDASTDNTPEILKKYESMDSRIRLIIHQENKRALIARNDLVRAAKGKYCIFADADDELLPDFFSSAAEILKKKHYDIVQYSFLPNAKCTFAEKRMGKVRPILVGARPMHNSTLPAYAILQKIRYTVCYNETANSMNYCSLAFHSNCFLFHLQSYKNSSLFL